MLLAQYDFKPRASSAAGKERLESAVHGLLGALRRNGQLWGHEAMGWVGGKLRVVFSVPDANALAPRHHSSEGKEAQAEVRSACARIPQLRVLGDGAHSPPRWRNDTALFLFTTMLDETSPVCGGVDGRPIPLYLLPITDRVRSNLVAWAAQYATLDRLHIASGALEHQAYRQLADPRSVLATEGRALAAAVEAATKLPTYYYLHRYWGRRTLEERRPCPGCGAVWSTGSVEGERGLGWFDFRCEPCRLVSHAGSTWEGSRLARIGDWPGAASRRRSVSGS